MLFISKYAPYTHMIEAGLHQPHPVTGARQIVLQPVHAEFAANRVVSKDVRDEAHRVFGNRRNSAGEFDGAYRTNGLITDPASESYGEMFSASEAPFRYGVFDSEADIDFNSIFNADLTARSDASDAAAKKTSIRKQVEDHLLASSDLGHTFIAITPKRREAPWPSYDKTHHNKIPAMVTELGLDPLLVAEYEAQRDKPREGVIAALKAQAAAAAAEKSIDNALSASV